MSADKHRCLELEVAYLRLASRTCGMSINIKGRRGITRLLQDMLAAGDLVQKRETGASIRGAMNVTVLYATPAGSDKLAAAEARFGTSFGPESALGRIEPVRLRKDERRKRDRTPEQVSRDRNDRRQRIERIKTRLREFQHERTAARMARIRADAKFG